jgi:enoyl-[acyl-carrier-protein] reductase (NADH)
MQFVYGINSLGALDGTALKALDWIAIAELYQFISQYALESHGLLRQISKQRHSSQNGRTSMNIAIKLENMVGGGTLAGKVSLVTGSTSGIGLGIARALAAAGSEIVLNGFGKPEDIADAQVETAEQGITCNAVCPGYVYTPLIEAQIDGQAKAHSIPREKVIRDVLLGQQPNKRFATVEELGALSVFLASDAAASITGIALPVDGGWTAH